MDTRTTYGEIIKKIIISHTEIPYPDENIKLTTVFDEQQERYLLMIIGRERINRKSSATRRVHGCLLHLEIINNKIWIQCDNTEEGIANELVAAGIPKQDIILGFHEHNIRQYTGFGVA